MAGYPKRAAARDWAAAKALKARTRTNLYNARPQWMADAHAALERRWRRMVRVGGRYFGGGCAGGVVGAVEFGGGGFLMWILLKSRLSARIV